jgi:hypothetical protein
MINITINRYDISNKKYIDLCDELVKENILDFDEILKRVEAKRDLLELVEVVNKCICIWDMECGVYYHNLTIKNEL